MPFREILNSHLVLYDVAAKQARDVSAGKTDVPEYTVKGRDEISYLGRSFNLMHHSLQNAIIMLEGT